MTDLGALTGADVRIDGQFEANESGPLLGLIGLDRIVAAEQRPARLEVSASGPLGRELRFEGKLAASPSMWAARAHCALRPVSRRRSTSISSQA